MKTMCKYILLYVYPVDPFIVFVRTCFKRLVYVTHSIKPIVITDRTFPELLRYVLSCIWTVSQLYEYQSDSEENKWKGRLVSKYATKRVKVCNKTCQSMQQNVAKYATKRVNVCNRFKVCNRVKICNRVKVYNRVKGSHD